MLTEAAAACSDEDDFQGMYAALGHAAEQESIRQLNPEGQHCSMLRISPNACDGCAKNPLEGRRATDRALIDENKTLLDQTLTLARYADFGIGNIVLQEFSSTEFMLAMLGRKFEMKQRDYRLAAQIGDRLAAEMGQIIAAIFGGGKGRKRA